MPHRIEVISKVPDTRAFVRQKRFQNSFPQINIRTVHVVDVFTIDKECTAQDLETIAQSLANPVTQTFQIDAPCQPGTFTWAIEIGYLPGVTDNIGTTSREIIQDLLKTHFEGQESVYTSQITYIDADLTAEQVAELSLAMANPLIQRINIKNRTDWDANGGMGIIVPKVTLHHEPKTTSVSLNLAEEELKKLGREGILDEDGTRRGPLALDMDYLQTIKNYFAKEGRNPTDVEIESIAQTWSEHCKHTIFAASIDEIKDGLYSYFIKRATKEIRKQKGEKDFCVSVFKDNSGGIVFDDNWIITDKVETHNSPSALDPFGGAVTGIVGVNRDSMGFGLGAKPVINRYGFCFGYPDDTEPLYRDKEKTQKMLSPRRILEGVIAGVNMGGNCSGIPTPQGFISFDKRYKGKPLVFVGTVGLIPRIVNEGPSWEKRALPGDLIVIVGGRTGQDGIHGATFSSESLSSGSPVTAVQIGDPITQKKFSDAIVKEARDLDLYDSITDNGAGGLSCSVSEMAKESGGCSVQLDKAPLKYPGLDPWQIWISESQERMTLAIPPQKIEQFQELMARRGVETTVIGEFTDSGHCTVTYNGETIMDVELEFLHNGLPQKVLTTEPVKVTHPEPPNDIQNDLTHTLLSMMSRPNIASYDFISHQYDHVVQAGTIIGPLQGAGRVNGSASVVAPVLTSHKGVVVSQGLNPKYSDIDTYHMAACAVDTAIRNALSIGGTLAHLALLDNFCWSSSNEPGQLYKLKQSAKACYDYAIAYGTPFISGKDSMFNDFNGYDEAGNKVKISAPETLVISSIGVVTDYRKCVTLDPKFAGDLVYILGETGDELGGSEYFDARGFVGNNVPTVNTQKAITLYRAFEKAVADGLIASSESIAIGGLAIALARKSIAGNLGMDIDLTNMPLNVADISPEHILFSESQSRFIVTISPTNKEKFETGFAGISFAQIGTVRNDETFSIKTTGAEPLIHTTISALNNAYHKTFKGY